MQNTQNQDGTNITPLLSEQGNKATIMADNRDVIYDANNSVQLDALKQLLNPLTKVEKKAAVKAGVKEVIVCAGQNGQIDVIEYLFTHLTEAERKVAIRAAGCVYLVGGAASNGHLDTLKYLGTYLSEEEIKRMFSFDDYHVIALAANNGHLDTLKYALTYLSKEEEKEAIRLWRIRMSGVRNDRGLNNRAINTNTINYLCKYKEAFAFLEKHDQEYGEQFIYASVRETLQGIAEEETFFKQENPNGVFNLDDENSEYCLHVLRNLIRRGVDRQHAQAEDLSNDIRYLLSIPGVRERAHQPFGENSEANDLLKQALLIGNESAAGILMQIPTVSELAAQNNYYSAPYYRDSFDGFDGFDSDEDEYLGTNDYSYGFQHEMDLAAIARDTESSMVSLSVSEKKLVGNVEAHYKDVIDEKGGIKAGAFDYLKADLKKRYQDTPAFILGNDNEKIELPFEWSELQILREELTDAQYDDALKAYYKNIYHTTHRYLSKPNYFMHPNASYVYVYEDDRQLRYASFEEYLTIIVPFYFAAIDENTPAIDEHSIESRTKLFFKQLALIGRAHNWDTKLPVLNKDGSEKKGSDGNLLFEEQDDLTADKPSCYSGVLKRLFQSVLGHGAFKVLNRNIIEAEIKEFAREHFSKSITSENKPLLKEAFDLLMTIPDSDEALSEEEMDAQYEARQEANIALQSVNISPEKVAEFEQALTVKYHEQFTDDPSFTGIIKRRFKQKDILGSDFQAFNTELDLDKLIQQKDSDLTKSTYAMRKLGFLAAYEKRQEPTQDAELKDDSSPRKNK